MTTSEPRPRKLLPTWAVALIAVLIAGVGFVLFRYVLADSPGAAECASVTGSDDAATVATADCGDEDATFRIAVKKDLSETGCPDGAYRELWTGENLLCLMPNFRAGNCYAEDDKNQSFRVSPCEGPDTIRISQVIDGTTDPSPCPNGSGLGYPEPPTVFCIETPGVS
ncbi:LppU/SCO3897 family protein [Actinokineospora iranica]|uniref:Uncharacterized protein n=1 Tax=Actinokineospora iranica TaxID=1271860 RepID=A0A1G6TFZ6_9PSEU|nr:hypothetical protein [Actinokineospora iranica]SDD27245.1 hypothetical protein SAMN05216174_10998 [Actinokineospora iranica]